MMNAKGQSLVQVLVSVAIMGILLSAMISTQAMQARENRALSERLAALDVQRTATAYFTVNDCTQLFAAGNLASGQSLSFNPAGVSAANPKKIQLKTLPSPNAAAPIAALNQNVSSLSPSLRVIPANGIELVVDSPSTATLQVHYDQNNLVRPIHDLVLPMSLVTGAPGTITNCATTGGGSSFGGVFITTNAGCNKPNPVTNALSCPPGYSDATFFTYMGINDNSCGAHQDQFFTHYCWK